MSQNKITLIGLFVGLVPAITWLFFWLQEDREHSKPKGLLIKVFMLGMASVILVVPFEQMAQDRYKGVYYMTVIWAALEEIIKYGVVYMTVLRTSRHISHPIDYPIYFVTAALGFAAFENTLFLIDPLSTGVVTTSLLTINLRFLGANLLHVLSSGIIGITLGLAYYRGWLGQHIYLFAGFFVAISLHSVFNFFITQNDGQNSFVVFGFLWIACIVLMLLFEKMRRMDISNLNKVE